MKNANNLQVREHNENLVRQALLDRREATRSQLARDTGLSQMTVGTVIAGLAAAGEVAEGASVPSAGGRPAAVYRYCAEKCMGIALYTYQRQGQTYGRLSVYNLFGDPVYQDGAYLPQVGPRSFDALLGRALGQVAGVGVLALGLPARAQGGEILASDHPALIGGELSRHCRELCRAPVTLINDVNAVMLGYGAARPREEDYLTAGFYFPGGFFPGMGLVRGQELWEGHRSFVGELGYLPFGAHWPTLDYGDQAAVERAVSDLLCQVCVLAGPKRAVLYGDFFTPGAGEAIRRRTEERFQGAYGLEVEVRPDPEPDYEAGMRALVLRRLKENLFGKFWRE